VGRGGERAAERLGIDVAHVRQRLADSMQQLGHRSDFDAGTDGGLQLLRIVRDQPVEIVERQDGALALHQLREGMPGPCDPDRTRRGLDQVRKFRLILRLGQTSRLGCDEARPVRPLVVHDLKHVLTFPPRSK
jgi:hypothetical protein